MVIELVLRNSLGCELDRQPVECDDLGYPLMLATFASVEVRSMVDTLQPGDTLSVEERD